ncbi:MAG: tRNA (adenosine(37)-N6)-threonylcarbamoyltransferase complex ATPase subunit type 1 TsaE [Oscillospiraceae bacterium]|nr:tRNA (adenosine(37)-N6)-threonylcarbamoyltransferase complex ATPase subunit type 1 TsaE [Oscillospiraceae bacterium]
MGSIVTNSAAETERFAQELARLLKPDDVLAFFGGLGMGKTTFVRGLACGLGGQDEVSSPTFSLVHEYRTQPKLYHFDMYRVTSFDDLYSTGFFDYLETGAILAIEWSENIEGALPQGYIRVTFERLDENQRRITVEGDERF